MNVQTMLLKHFSMKSLLTMVPLTRRGIERVFEILSKTKLWTSTYKPMASGAIKPHFKCTLISYINKKQNDSEIHLLLALFSYRTSI